jgi:hypothetical protein
MGILDGIKDGFNEVFSDAPEWKGTRFERYVENLFNPDIFATVEKTHRFKKDNERYVESDMNPDFVFRHKPSNSLFAVEAKYRSSLYKEKLHWCDERQFERYKQFAIDRKMPVYIVIGFAGVDDDPQRMFLIPLEEAKYPALFPSIFNKYSRNPKDNFFWKNGELY